MFPSTCKPNFCNVVPSVMCALNTKVNTKLEAIELHTIAIIAISSGSEFYMP
jgi:hypothetical protein